MRRDAPAWSGAALAVVVTLTVLAGALRFWALDFGLPHVMARPDEETILQRTALPAQGKFDPEWGTYPSGFLYLTWAWGAATLRGAQALGYAPPGTYLDTLRTHPETILLLDRVLPALAGTVTVPLVVALARPALGFPAAAGAGLLVATSFLHVRDSHTIKPDVLLTLLMVVAIAGLLPLARRATVARGARGGLLVGLATAVKYPGIVMLVPAWVAARLGYSRARGWRRLVPLPAVVAGLVAVAVLLATSPDLLWNPRTRQNLWALVPYVFGHVPGVAAPPTPPHVPGYPDLSSFGPWDRYAYHVSFSLRYGAGLLATLLAPVALVWGLASAAPQAPLALLVAVAAGSYYLLVGSSAAILTRYMTPLVPLLAVLEAGCLSAVVRRWAPAHRHALATALAVAVVAAEPLAASIAHDRLAARTDTRVLATRWMAEHLPPGANVVILGAQIWAWGSPQVPPSLRIVAVPPSPEALAGAKVGYVVTHDHTLFSSHLQPLVMETLAPHLRLLAEFDPFVPGRAGDAVFELIDAYYIPVHGFDALTRPGPHVRIYAFE